MNKIFPIRLNERSFHIYFGSLKYFEEETKSVKAEKSFIEIVIISDYLNREGKTEKKPKVDKLLIKNYDYHGLVNEAHYRLLDIIIESTSENARIYIHNPTTHLVNDIKRYCNESKATYKIKKQEYVITTQVNTKQILEKLNGTLIGQENAVEEIAKSILYHTKSKNKKPYVIMLYGKSSIGKTEMVKEVGKLLFSNSYLEKHLSMFQNDQYATYFFGGSPNSKSLAYELMERENNLIFFDELDKCPPGFFSAFYTLFDNDEFLDNNYRVDISNLLIFLTSNYFDEQQMKQELGEPIFYRIDKFVKFDDFNKIEIEQLVDFYIDKIDKDIIEKQEKEEFSKRVKQTVFTKDENARTIKKKVREMAEIHLLEKEMKQ
jgi:ATP-dependent Clp protease ATP-binding subunit ClpA